MSFPQLVRRLAHLGVAPDTPPSDARYIIIVNSVSLLGVLVSSIYFPVNLTFQNRLLVQVGPPSLSILLYALPLWLNYRKRYWAATTLLFCIAFSTQILFTFTFGVVSGNHFYLLPIVGGVTLLYPRRHWRTAATLVFFGLLVFWALVLLGDKVPALVSVDAEIARLYYTLALVLAAALVAFVCYYAHSRTAILESKLEARSRELTQTLQELQATQAQMIDSENQAIVGRLVSGLLHEINTPLGSIRSAANSISRAVARWGETVIQNPSPPNPDQETARRHVEISSQLCESLEVSTERIATVVEGLRQFVALDEAERKPVDVRQGIDGALAVLGAALQDRIEVVRNYPDSVSKVVGHPAKLNRVFLSLLQNSVQAIEEKGTIRVTVRERGGHIEIEVRDDGRGIPAAKIPEILQLGLTRKAGRIGLRLGLPISKRTIEDMGGTLTLESNEGEHTTVRLTLPIATRFEEVLPAQDQVTRPGDPN